MALRFDKPQRALSLPKGAEAAESPAGASMTPGDVVHNTAVGRFEVRAGEEVAVLDYTLSSGVIVFVHTGVPPALEGKGIGSQLARAGLEFARREGLRVVPRCPFIRAYLEKHESEYGALWRHA